ncbi:uncharacterized protein LOC143470018 [Clavelina lepadiformis]|uniref:uncharacterized protein LOC143470018 n=1 Tax=Clavelina lepadiformis TaxID=159417 RepID=UPI0040437305
MRSFILAVACFAIGCLSQSCPNITGRNLTQMPALDPVQFSYHVEITIEGLNKTLNGYEFYDLENETLFFSLDQSNGSLMSQREVKVVYDYKHNQTFYVDDNAFTCNVGDLDSSKPHQFSLFGVGIENGPQNVTHAFYWNGTYNVTYEGLDIVAGITTDHYQTCVEFDDGNLTYLVDVYFSVDTWNMPSGQQSPVLLKLNATDNTGDQMIYTYKFSDYLSSTSFRIWRPKLPHEIVCLGRKDAPPNPFLNDAPSFISQVEVIEHHSNEIFSYEEYFDYAHNIVLFKFNNRPGVAGPLALSWTQDFNLGLAFFTNYTTGQCSISNITTDSIFDSDVAIDTNTSKVRLMKSSEIIKEVDLVYGGVGRFSHQPAHIWIAQQPLVLNNHGNKIYEYQKLYWSVNEVHGYEYPLGMEANIMAEVNGTNMTTTTQTHVYGQMGFVDNLEVFDYSYCFGEDLRKTVVLRFSADYYDQAFQNPKSFTRAFHDTVANKAQIYSLRVSHDHPYTVAMDNSGNKYMYVWATLLGIPDVQGNSVEMKPQINLTTALNNLQQVVANNELEVSFHNTTGDVVQMTAHDDYWMMEADFFNPATSPTPTPSPDPSNPNPGVNPGAVAGIAIGTFVAGMLVVYLFSLWKGQRHRGQFAYTMQE